MNLSTFGVYFRRVFTWGPFQLMLSRTGAGISVRVFPGVRVGRDAGGSFYVSVTIFGWNRRFFNGGGGG